MSCLAPTKRKRRKDVCLSEAETCLVLKRILVCKTVDFRITCYLDLKEHEPALGHFVPNGLFSRPVVANTLGHSTAL